YMEGMIEIGDISLCIGSVSVFTAAVNAMFSGFVSVGLMEQRINDFKAYQKIDMNDYVVDGTKTIDFSQGVTLEFKDVSYSYPNSTVEILHNINFKISKGEKIAIVGENGAGKTTFVKLLLRLYVPTKGRVLLNGVDYCEYSIQEY
ncbi:MAG: ATP-binding cassette domain-containing protein, partial [Lachnospiraceae bacterium]|nr:ATP-binding cassette domain-containing protein [Lachnospiraceae bacterium]